MLPTDETKVKVAPGESVFVVWVLAQTTVIASLNSAEGSAIISGIFATVNILILYWLNRRDQRPPRPPTRRLPRRRNRTNSRDSRPKRDDDKQT